MMEQQRVIKGDPILLWEDGPPFAKGSSSEDQPRLTPYIVDSHQPTGAIVICPGGGYVMRANHEGEDIALWLGGLGISAFVLDYRVAPYRHPVPLLDAQRAIRLVRYRAPEWNIRAHHIGIFGSSAGGHLAATTATYFDQGRQDASDPIDRQACRPDAVILSYPVITFGEARHHGSMISLLGETDDEDLIQSLSLETRVSANTPPCFIWHTADDAAVPVENALLFAGALRNHRVPHELHVFEHGQHGLGLAPDEPDVAVWTQLCNRWLQRQGF